MMTRKLLLLATIALSGCILGDDTATDDQNIQSGGDAESACCEASEEPGIDGSGACFEGAICCADGSWRCNDGQGNGTCNAALGAGEICETDDDPPSNPGCDDGVGGCEDDPEPCDPGMGTTCPDDPNACCDATEMPGAHGNATCFEGATCCADGSWQCNDGQGNSTCDQGTSAGDTCA